MSTSCYIPSQKEGRVSHHFPIYHTCIPRITTYRIYQLQLAEVLVQFRPSSYGKPHLAKQYTRQTGHSHLADCIFVSDIYL